MAKGKTKDELKQAPKHIKKTKRNKHKTECSINRKNGCGICGSLNIVRQGVKFCNICGKEEDFISEYLWSFMDVDYKRICDCKDPECFRYTLISRSVGVIKCVDCGAVQDAFCPNHKRHSCWKSSLGDKKYCPNCGFRETKKEIGGKIKF